MKKVYFIVTNTGTILSKIIKGYTKAEYQHVSISLDKKLNKMYSFGRKNPYIAFIGGFVKEHPNKGTFKRFKNTTCRIIEYSISDKQYNEIEALIEEMYKNRNKLKFNTIGLFAVAIKKKYQPEDTFYCAEFVKYIVEKSKLRIDLPEIVEPENFKDIEGREIYRGLFREYLNQ